MFRLFKAILIILFLFTLGEIGTRLYLSNAYRHFPSAPETPDEFGNYERFLQWGKKLGYFEDYQSGGAYYYTPYLGVINRPGYRFKFKNYDVEINSDGLRAPEIISPKPKDVFRVFILGGSTVAGGINEKNSISYYLNDLLHPKTKKLELINGGIVGYASWNELALLELKIIKLQPDLIVILDGRNDLYYANFPEAAPEFQQQQALNVLINSPKPIRLIRYVIKTLGHQSALLTALFRLAFERKAVLIKAPAPHFESQRLTDYASNWKAIQAFAEAHDLPALLVFQPTLAYGKETYSSYEQSVIRYREEVEKTDWIQTVPKLWEKTSARVASLKNTKFVKVHDLSRLFLHDSKTEYVDDCHYSATACRQIAEALARLAQHDFPEELR